jgi:hypothetical protein
LSNQTIAQLQKDKKLLGYVQLTPSSRSTTDRYISLVDKKGQIVGFGLPVNNYSFSVSARRPTDKGLVDAPELVKLLAKGELSVGPEYFKVYNSTQFKSNLIGLMQVPEKLETSRGAYLSMASRSQITFGSSFF